MTTRRQDGSVSTELVLLTPVLLALLAFVVFAGRVGGAQQQITAAADQAARAASLRGDPDSAIAAASQVAQANLADAGVTCADVGIEVDTAAFGAGGQVGVTVTCVVELDDVVFAGLPGSRTFTSTAVEVVDRYRGGD